MRKYIIMTHIPRHRAVALRTSNTFLFIQPIFEFTMITYSYLYLIDSVLITSRLHLKIIIQIYNTEYYMEMRFQLLIKHFKAKLKLGTIIQI